MWSETRIGVIGSVDSGKCFAINTQILMNDKSTKMIQDIKIGEFVMGDDYKTSKMVRMLVKGKSEMFKVYQKKGIDYRVNKHHILSLKIRNNKYKKIIEFLKSIDHFPDKENIIDINVATYYTLPGYIKKIY